MRTVILSMNRFKRGSIEMKDQDVFDKLDESTRLRREKIIIQRVLSTGYSKEVVVDEHTTKDLEARVEEIERELRQLWSQ